MATTEMFNKIKGLPRCLVRYHIQNTKISSVKPLILSCWRHVVLDFPDPHSVADTSKKPGFANWGIDAMQLISF